MRGSWRLLPTFLVDIRMLFELMRKNRDRDDR
jgi:hypothetical protein